jgi:hypothetical protein
MKVAAAQTSPIICIRNSHCVAGSRGGKSGYTELWQNYQGKIELGDTGGYTD